MDLGLKAKVVGPSVGFSHTRKSIISHSFVRSRPERWGELSEREYYVTLFSWK